jgi:hypothetical protein
VAFTDALVVDDETADVIVSALGADGTPLGATQNTRAYGAHRLVLVLNGVPWPSRK